MKFSIPLLHLPANKKNVSTVGHTRFCLSLTYCPNFPDKEKKLRPNEQKTLIQSQEKASACEIWCGCLEQSDEDLLIWFNWLLNIYDRKKLRLHLSPKQMVTLAKICASHTKFQHQLNLWKEYILYAIPALVQDIKSTNKFTCSVLFTKPSQKGLKSYVP